MPSEHLNDLQAFLVVARARLLPTVGRRFEEIEAALAGLNELREKPAGTIRITATEHAASTILWPRLARLLPK